MPTLHRIGNIKIAIYSGEHNPPHFHVITPDERASVVLGDLSLSAGELSARTMKIVTEWAENNRELILNKWMEMNG